MLSERRFVFDADGAADVVRRLVVHAADDAAAARWEGFLITAPRWLADAPSGRARIIDPDGGEERREPLVFADTSDAADAAVRWVGWLPPLRPGSVLVLEAVARHHLGRLPGGAARTLELDAALPVDHARVLVEAPAGLPVAVRALGLAEGDAVRVERAGGDGGAERVRFVLEAGPFAARARDEPDGPSALERAVRVVLSTGRSWEDVAAAYAAAMEPVLAEAAGDPDLAAFAATHGGAATSTRAAASALLAAVRARAPAHGVRFGEAPVLPASPAHTLTRGHGQTQDVAALLVALLRLRGHRAHLALVSEAPEPEPEPGAPGLDAFARVLAVAEDEGGADLWLDPAPDGLRAGELAAALEDRPCLVVRAGATLARTPRGPPGTHGFGEHAEAWLPVHGFGRGVTRIEWRGAREADIRRAAALAGEAGVVELFAQPIRERAAFTEVSVRGAFGGLDHPDEPLTLRLDVEPVGRTVSGVAVADTGDDAQVVWVPEWLDAVIRSGAPLERTLPLRLEPCRVQAVARVHAPSGYIPIRIPPAARLEVGPARFERTSRVDGAAVEVVRTFDLGDGRFTAEEARRFAKELGELVGRPSLTVTFQHRGLSLVNAGRAREGLAVLRRLAAAEPDEPAREADLAVGLCQAGLRDAGLARARRAVERAPELSAAWAALAYALARDQAGALHGPGFDHAGAVEAGRRAVELDPLDVRAIEALGLLLEHDASGRRYGFGVDVDAALAVYRGRPEVPGREQTDIHVAMLLLWHGRADELRAHGDALPAAPDNARWSIAARALAAGPDAALRWTAAALPDLAGRAAAVEAAVQALALARHHGVAQRLADAAASAAGLGEAASLRRTASSIASLRPFDPNGRVDLRDANEVAPRWMALVALADTADPRGLAHVLAALPPYLREPARARADALWTAPRLLALQAGEAGWVGRQRVADRFYAGVSRGARWVRGGSLGIVEVLEIPIYVARAGDEVTVLGTSDTRELLGVEALVRLERGDLDGAIDALDLARQHLFEDVRARSRREDGRLDPAATLRAPFPVAWAGAAKRGATAPSEAEVRLAAILLAAEVDPARAARHLAACEAAGAGAELADAVADRDRALLLAVARAAIADARRDGAELGRAADELSALFPGLPEASALTARAALHRGDPAAACAALASLAARAAWEPADSWGVHALVDASVARGDLAAALAAWERWLAGSELGGRARAVVGGEAAWLALHLGAVDRVALDRAREAAKPASRGAAPPVDALFRLACLLADSGAGEDAIARLREARLLRGARPEDAWVLGRLAEHWGEPEAARDAYEEARGAADDGSPRSVRRLAERRLAALEAAAERER